MRIFKKSLITSLFWLFNTKLFLKKREFKMRIYAFFMYFIGFIIKSNCKLLVDSLFFVKSLKNSSLINNASIFKALTFFTMIKTDLSYFLSY